jgi:hypothetical protein
MKRVFLSVLMGAWVLVTPAFAQLESSGQYARIAFLRPHDGDTVDFEAGYIRHLDWHRQVGDRWVWYGWNIWAGERQRSLVYATFGHSAESLNNPVQPAEDERDNISNVTPHASYVGNGLYEFLPRLSRGNGTPTPTARAELLTVQLEPGAEERFEAALRRQQATLRGETLWFRMVAGGRGPLYVRIRARSNLAELLNDRREGELPQEVEELVTERAVEILSFRPTLSYGVTPTR